MSLRSKLTLLQVLIVVAGIGLLGGVLTGTLEAALIREIDDVLQLRADEVSRELRRMAPGGIDPSELGALRLDPQVTEELAAPGVYVQVARPDGQVVRASRSAPTGWLPGADLALRSARDRGPSLETIPAAGGERIRLFTTPVADESGVVAIVQVGESLHQVDVVLRRLLRLLAVVGGGVLLVTTVATWLVVGRALRPLERIATTAETIAATGDVALRVDAVPSGEIGRLARSFNRMVDRLRGLLDSQRQLLADTSHELRNPLTVIRTNLDLLRRDLDPATRQEVVAETDSEAERMSHLVADLLLLAREEATSPTQLVTVRLDRLAKAGVDRFQSIAPDHVVALTHSEPLVVRGDPDRLRQLLANLLENAVRYTPPGGRVDVAVRRVGSKAELAVSDTGIGIPPEHLPRVFDRFYRVDPARNRATGGSGLGLAIVKYIAAGHGGSVAVESEVGRGSRFTVLLPAEPSWTADEPATETPTVGEMTPSVHR